MTTHHAVPECGDLKAMVCLLRVDSQLNGSVTLFILLKIQDLAQNKHPRFEQFMEVVDTLQRDIKVGLNLCQMSASTQYLQYSASTQCLHLLSVYIHSMSASMQCLQKMVSLEALLV